MAAGSAQDPRVGTVIGGRFRIDAVLGQGGMGTVYRATQLSVERQVAVKLISHQVASQPEFIKRFSREAKVTSQLSHPHTIQLHDFGGTEDGALYLVVELLEGRELSALLEAEGQLAPERALGLVRKLLKSLAEAHDKGIVHRDLKPDNVFMCRVSGEEDFPKVMDFGIASAGLSPDATKLTVEGSLLGTPAYMSPEQAHGASAGPAADVYALGIMLYEMLTGRLPFTGPTAMSLLMKHVNEPPPPLRDVLPVYGADHPLQQLLDRWLAKDPAVRTADATQALAEVDAVLGGGSLVGIEANQAPDHGAGEGATAAALLGTLPNGGGGRLRLVWLAAAAIVLLGVVAAWSIASGPAAKPSAAAGADIPAARAEEAVAAAGGPVVAAPQAPAATGAGGPKEADGEPPGAGEAATREAAHATERKGAPQREARERRAAAAEAAERRAAQEAEERRAAERAAQRRAAQEVEERRAQRAASRAAQQAARDKRAETPPAHSEPSARPAPAPTKPAAPPRRPETRKEKRLRMAAEGTPYPSIAAVKAAYRAKRISPEDYEDIVWALKRRYKLRIRELKLKYKAGEIDRRTYDRLAAQAERDYRG